MTRVDTQTTRFAAAFTHAAISRPFWQDVRRMANNPELFRPLPEEAPRAPEPEPMALVALVA